MKKLNLSSTRISNLNFSIITLLLLPLLLCSCHKETTKSSHDIDYSKIAGTWKAENAFWKLEISKDGMVKSAVIQMGEATVRPNETTYIEMKDKKISSFKSGDFPLIYDPHMSELEITLNIKEIHIRFLENKIDGSNKILIGGIISEDGKIWDAEIFEFFDYGPRFPRDNENILGVSYRFVKQES